MHLYLKFDNQFINKKNTDKVMNNAALLYKITFVKCSLIKPVLNC